MTSSGGSGAGGLTPSIEGSEREQFVSVDEDERQFGRYHLRFEIASGGMATVYLARSKGPAGFDRALAVKRIHPHLAKKKEFVDMFLDEARLSARISHPNVCSVFDFGEVDGTYFMAMEYLVGQPMSSLLRAMHVRPEIASSRRWHALAAKIIADACEGLHAAHELSDERGVKLGVVHRDCTPHNIFITYDGAVKVVDFGVALAEGRLHQTQTGALKGKLGYMSPEQVRGHEVDRRLDVWALGVCLWELLVVKRLFAKRQEVELIQAVANDPISPPSMLRAEVPAELDRIVMKALERDLDRRYPTARAMARDLNAFVSTSGVSAGLADLSELMEELFTRERETKLGVVASVLTTGSDSVPAGSKSGPRVIEGGLVLPPTTILPLTPDPEPDLTPTTARARAFAQAPPRPASALPAWVLPSALAGVLLIALVGVGIAATLRAPAPEATPLPIGPAPSGPVRRVGEPVIDRVPSITGATEPQTPLAASPATPGTREPLAAETARPMPEPTDVAPSHATPHARTGPGTINITVAGGWADIYVDGERRGRTPRAVRVAPGRHDVELRRSGQPPGIHRVVTVRSGSTALVAIPLGD